MDHKPSCNANPNDQPTIGTSSELMMRSAIVGPGPAAYQPDSIGSYKILEELGEGGF